MSNSMTRRACVVGGIFAAQAAPQPLRLPKKIRVGIIGLEGHLTQILNPLDRLPDVELAAICEADPAAMAAALRGRPAGIRQYTDYRQLLDREKLDVVGIGGVHGERPSIILACAERKLHVVAEKPLAIERADLARVKQAVAKNGIRLTMLLSMRFTPNYLAIKGIVDSGQIGEVAQMASHKSYRLGRRPAWMLRRATYGGSLLHVGVHLIDLMRWTSGRELVEAAAFEAHVGFPDYGEMENTAAASFRLDNGGTAACRIDYLAPDGGSTYNEGLRLAGTKGIVDYQPGIGLTLMSNSQKPRRIVEVPPERSLFMNFLDSVYNGRPAMLSFDDVCRVNEIALAARESGDRHQMVKT
jgi:predicted dehydrogenase